MTNKKTKILILRISLLIALLFWCGLIFYFSSQNGNSSTQTSGKITETTIDIFVPGYETYPIEKQSDIFTMLNNIIRKSAHFLEYMVLAILCLCFLLTFKIKTIFQIIITFIFVTLYAISDEIHQGFVDSRAPMLKDVLIDCSGGLLGIFIVSLTYFLILKHKRKIINHKTVVNDDES